MESFKLSLALLSCMALTLVSSSRAQDAPEDYIKAHNAARATVGVGPMTWDNKLAAYTQNYANKLTSDCELVPSGGPYGENLAMSYGELTATNVVAFWVSEKPDYDYNSNTCAAGKMCGHYTQVVWRNSVRLGCAKVRCKNGGTLISCNYDPPGNVIGERPY